MGAQSGSNRRRNILSLPSAQLRIMGLFAALAVLYAALNVYISKRAFDRLATDAFELELPARAAHDLNVLVLQHEATLDLQLTLFVFLSFCMVTMAGVLLSHRLGGPVFHLKKYLKDVSDGTASPRELRFRKGDFFHDLASAFNDFQRARGMLPPAGTPTDPGRGTKAASP